MKRLLVGLIIGLVLVTGCTKIEKPESKEPIEETPAEERPIAVPTGEPPAHTGEARHRRRQRRDETITKLIKQLGDEDWTKREEATTELFNIGNPALPFLEEAFKQNPEPEIRLRAQGLIKGINIKLAIPPETLEHLPGVLIKALNQLGFNLFLELILQLDKLPREVEPTPEQSQEIISLCLKQIDWTQLPLKTKQEIISVFQRYRLVPEIVKRLEDNDKDVRETAIKALSELGTQEAVPEIIKQLKDNDRDVRRAAVRALGKLGNKVAVSELIKLLEDEDNDREIRRAAVKALVESDTAAGSDFIKLLEDNDTQIRRAAVKALVKSGTAAVSEFIKLLEDNDTQIRCVALKALGDLGAKEAVSEIIKRLKDANEKVRKAAQKVLREWGVELPEDDEE